MCQECGCGLPGETPIEIHDHSHEGPHSHRHEHHGHWHEHPHEHGHGEQEHEHPHESPSSQAAQAGLAAPDEARRTVELRRSILEKNDRLAERNRGFFRARGLFVLNVLSAPGSGKTTLLRETVRSLEGKVKAGIVVGDLATDNDAQRLRQTGAPVVQITTGTVCHLEAEMVARAVNRLDLSGLGLVIIENVGNLVCPASYDLGEDLRVVLLSVTEGEDKPLKYPPIFHAAHSVVITKIDLAEACGFDRTAALSNIRRIAPTARIFESSAKTGQGMTEWTEFILEQCAEARKRDPLSV